MSDYEHYYEDCTVLTEDDFDYLLKKGWTKNHCGNEYIYDYEIPNSPIVIKISSTVKVDEDRRENKGSHQIRVHSILKTKSGKYLGGAKAIRIDLTINWRDEVKEALKQVKNRSIVIARKQGLIK